MPRVLPVRPRPFEQMAVSGTSHQVPKTMASSTSSLWRSEKRTRRPANAPTLIWNG